VPPECHIDSEWAKHVVPTLVYWLGCQCQKNPWHLTLELVLGVLRTTCQELYLVQVVKKIPLDSIEDEPFVVVSIFLWILRYSHAFVADYPVV
jgi:hypothetical protein